MLATRSGPASPQPVAAGPDRHSPWQRGQIENLNRQWRSWYPRGTDHSIVEQARVDHGASIINGQRRRSLAYQSPTALYAAAAAQ